MGEGLCGPRAAEPSAKLFGCPVGEGIVREGKGVLQKQTGTGTARGYGAIRALRIYRGGRWGAAPDPARAGGP